MSEQAVTLRFTGPSGEAMANHFFSSWVDGELSQVFAEALDDAEIAASIEYDGDSETRTLTVGATAADDEEDAIDDEEEADEDDTEIDEAVASQADDDASEAA